MLLNSKLIYKKIKKHNEEHIFKNKIKKLQSNITKAKTIHPS